jgi:transposase-like protein
LNNWTESEYEFLSSTLSGLSGCQWIIGKEIGAEKTPHLQGYAWRPKGWRPLPTLLVGDGRCHFERAKGNKDQNYDRCSKEGEFAGNLARSLASLERERWVEKYTEEGGSQRSFARRHGLPRKPFCRWLKKAEDALAAKEASSEDEGPAEVDDDGKYARARAAILARLSHANVGEFGSGWKEDDEEGGGAHQGYLIAPFSLEQHIVRLLELHAGVHLSKKDMAVALIEQRASRQSPDATHLFRTKIQEKAEYGRWVRGAWAHCVCAANSK